MEQRDDFYGLRKLEQEIGPTIILGREEERELIRKAKKGDQDAVVSLISGVLRWIIGTASNYSKGKNNLPDLVQEGIIATMKAIKKFDLSYDNKFITYAKWWIKQAIFLAICEKEGDVKISVHTIRLINKIGKFRRKFLEENNYQPLPEEIAIGMEISLKTIKMALRALFILKVKSLDAPTESENEMTEPLLSVIPDTKTTSPEEFLQIKEKKKIVKKAVFSLEPKGKIILTLRFLVERQRTLEEVSKILKVSIERVRQIETTALKRLGRKLSEKGLKLDDYI